MRRELPYGTRHPCLHHYYVLSFPSSLPGSPHVTGASICNEVLHFTSVLGVRVAFHSVFIRLITDCLRIHKLIRWMFMNLMYCFILYLI